MELKSIKNSDGHSDSEESTHGSQFKSPKISNRRLGNTPSRSQRKRERNQPKVDLLKLPYRFKTVGLAHVKAHLGVDVLNGTEQHSHPVCAFERTQAVNWMMDHAKTDTISFIGGNPNAAMYRDSRIIILDNGEAKNQVRVQQYRHSTSAVIMDPSMLINDAAEDIEMSRTYVFVHQLFEISNDDLLSMMIAAKDYHTEFYAIYMPLDRPKLAAGEVEWCYVVVDGMLRISIDVLGNGLPYICYPQYLHQRGIMYGTGNNEGYAVTIDTRYQFGDTRVVRLDLIKAVEPKVVLKDVIRTPRKFAGITVSMSTYDTGAQLNFIATLHGLFNPVSDVLVPTELIASCIEYMIGKERNHDTYKSAIRDAKVRAKQLKIDSNTKADAIPFAVALAFNYVETEMAAYRMVQGKSISTTMYNLTKIDLFSSAKYQAFLWTVYTCLSIGGLAYNYYNWKRARPQSNVAWVVACVGISAFLRKWGQNSFRLNAILSPFVLILFIRHMYSRYEKVKSQIKSNSIANAAVEFVWPGGQYTTNAGFNVEGLYNTQINSLASVCMDGRELAVMAPDTDIQVGEVQCRETFGCMQVGWSTIHVRPVVARACTHNAIVSTVNRCLGVTPRPTRNWVRGDSMDGFIDAAFDADLTFEVPFRVYSVYEWARRFPPRVCAELIQAHAELMDHGYCLKFLSRKRIRKTFVKIEKIIDPKYLDDISYDPRLIQGATPQWQAASGPLVYSMYMWIKQQWHVQARVPLVTLGPGHTGDELGRWYRKALKYTCGMGDVKIFMCDFSRWDMTLTRDALGAEGLFYQKVFTGRMSEAQLKRLRGLITIGLDTMGVFVKDGTFYRSPGKRKSGDSNTTLGNSVLNAYATYLAFRKYGVDSFRMIVAGDDNLVITSAKVNIRRVENEYRALGLQPKLNLVGQWAAEFCSGRYYPVNEKPYYVHGPKIGRILARTGYSHNLLKPGTEYSWLRSVCIGLRKNVQYIPILRVLIKRIIELTEGIMLMPIRDFEFKFNVQGEYTMSDDAYYMVDEVYGLSRDQVDHIEKQLMEITSPTFVFDNDIVKRLVEVDCPNKKDEFMAALSLWETLKPFMSDYSRYVGSVLFSNMASIWISIIFAPVLEELIKRGHWNYFLILVGGETVTKLLMYGPEQALFGIVTHYFFMKLPLPLGIFLHGFYNFIALLTAGMLDDFEIIRALRWATWDVASRIILPNNCFQAIRNWWTGAGVPAKVSPDDKIMQNDKKTIVTTTVDRPRQRTKSQSGLSRNERRRLRAIQLAKLRMGTQVKIDRLESALGQGAQGAGSNSRRVAGAYDLLRKRTKNSTARGIPRERLRYLESLANPDQFMSIIPDMTTCPRTVAQIRTVGQWSPDANGNGCVYMSPYINQGYEVAGSSTLLVDGVQYSDNNFNCHNYADWAVSMGSYRTASMEIICRFVGGTLQDGGTIAAALIPPEFNSSLFPNTVATIQEYNRSKCSPARDGMEVVWLPASAVDFMVYPTNFTAGADNFPFLALAFAGVTVAGTAPYQAMFELELIHNIEAFSLDQILTAPKDGVRNDPIAMATATNTMSLAVARGMHTSAAGKGTDRLEQIMQLVPKAAGFLWENRTPILEGAAEVGAMLGF